MGADQKSPGYEALKPDAAPKSIKADSRKPATNARQPRPGSPNPKAGQKGSGLRSPSIGPGARNPDGETQKPGGGAGKSGIAPKKVSGDCPAIPANGRTSERGPLLADRGRGRGR